VTWAAWLGIAAAALVCAAPGAAPVRVVALADRGRLACVGSGAGPVGSRLARSRRVAGVWFAGAAVLGLLPVAAVGGPALAVAAAAVCAAGRLLSRDAARRRAAVRRHAELLRALRVLIGELEAGARPAAALAAASGDGGSCARVFAAAAAAAEHAADAASVLVMHPQTRAVGVAWRLGEQVGAELAGVLARVARDLSAVDEQRRAVAIALAGPRASAVLLTGLPLVGLALGVAVGARPEAFLFGAPIGRAVCCAGVLLDVTGVLWMRRILRRAEQP
jgi:tight adherence protein B